MLEAMGVGAVDNFSNPRNEKPRILALACGEEKSCPRTVCEV